MALSSSEYNSSGYTGFRKLDTAILDLLRELLALATVGEEE